MPLRGPDTVVETVLEATPPFPWRQLLAHLAATATPGVEEVRAGTYRRTLRLPAWPAIVELTPADDAVRLRARLGDERDVGEVIARSRHLLDLDAEPATIDALLASDPVLAPSVAGVPGRRVARTMDRDELALLAVLGQQISTAAARTHAGRLAAEVGTPVDDPDGGLTRLFPSPDVVAGLDDGALRLPRTRQRTIRTVAAALADGTVDLGPAADQREARDALLHLWGVGPWTVEVIAMRALGDRDAFPATDLGVLVAARQVGLPGEARDLGTHAERWRPYRAYAVQQLWSTLDHAVNRAPVT
jgi:AraC family transcriptional regulator of adaptative response / DNA-3-methyladenine glycosylase II